MIPRPEQRLAPGGAHRPEVVQPEPGPAAHHPGQRDVGDPRVHRPGAPHRTAPAEHQVGRPVRTGSTTRGSWAGSIEPSASQKQTTSAVAASSPAWAAAPNPRCGTVDHGRAVCRGDRRGPVGRPVVGDDRPEAGRQAGEHPGQGRGLVEAGEDDVDLCGIRRHAGCSRREPVRFGSPHPAPAAHTLRLMTLAEPDVQVAPARGRRMRGQRIGLVVLVAVGVAAVWQAGRRIIADGGDLHLRGGAVLTGGIDPLLSARVLLPLVVAAAGVLWGPALARRLRWSVAAGRKRRGCRGLGRRARSHQRLGPARRAHDEQARVPGRRRPRAPRQPRVDVRRLGAGRVTGAVGHPRRRTSSGRAALVRPARPDRPRRAGLGGRRCASPGER